MNPADYSLLIMSLLIAAYGTHQYIKREKEHRALLQRIIDGNSMALHAAVGIVKLPRRLVLMLAFIEVLLVALVIWVVCTRSKVFNAGDATNLIVLVYLILALPGAFGVFNPALWRLLTLAFIEVLLVGSVIWLVHTGSKILYGAEVAYIIAFFFVALFAFLLPVLVRDIRAYRNK